jgi:hypothetical protein
LVWRPRIRPDIRRTQGAPRRIHGGRTDRVPGPAAEDETRTGRAFIYRRGELTTEILRRPHAPNGPSELHLNFRVRRSAESARVLRASESVARRRDV